MLTREVWVGVPWFCGFNMVALANYGINYSSYYTWLKLFGLLYILGFMCICFQTAFNYLIIELWELSLCAFAFKTLLIVWLLNYENYLEQVTLSCTCCLCVSKNISRVRSHDLKIYLLSLFEVIDQFWD